MHYMDYLGENVLTEIAKAPNGVSTNVLSFTLQDFAAPSWNRLLLMHRMQRMKMRHLIHNIVAETLAGRTVSELCKAEYDAINRPSKKKKDALKGFREAERPEHRRLERMLQNGLERPTITERPPWLNGYFAVSFMHYRKRLTDVDNLSVKAVLDGMVVSGLIKDDSPKHVHEVQQLQTKAGEDVLQVFLSEVIELKDE